MGVGHETGSMAPVVTPLLCSRWKDDPERRRLEHATQKVGMLIILG